MNENLSKTLAGLRANPALAIDLYKQLFSAELFAVVPPVTIESVEKMGFLTYDTADGIRELPLFTSREIVDELKLPVRIVAAQVPGRMLWPRVLQVINEAKAKTHVAVNPTRPDGIRLTVEMIMWMISKYSGEQG